MPDDESTKSVSIEDVLTDEDRKRIDEARPTSVPDEDDREAAEEDED